MKSLIKILLSCLLFMSGIVSAGVTPLVISSEFKTENWFPLPVDQMESAAVDAALTRLSGFGQFAFLNNPDAGLIKRIRHIKLFGESGGESRISQDHNKAQYA